MKTYTFKHPITKQWVEIIADSFAKALQKLRQVNA
jgi:hypothetical protein